MVNADLVAAKLAELAPRPGSPPRPGHGRRPFRKVVDDGYGGVDVASVHAAATTGLLDLEAFASQVSAWVTRRAGAGD